MIDFKIKRGLSTTLFVSPGVINPRLVIEEGCWYLCTDTATLFLGLATETGELTLKRINEVETDTSLTLAIEELQKQIALLEDIELFRRIETESDLPKDFDSEEFNPNITYYIPQSGNKVSTYIFDKGSGSFICTNNIDETIIRAMATEAIEDVLESTFSTKLPEMIKDTLSKNIIYGGNAIN